MNDLRNNKNKLSLLVTQSFILGSKRSYWDYRDYIFSLCSNLSIKDAIFRLNVEKGEKEWINEIIKATKFYNFSNILITNYKPSSWDAYMLEQISKNPTFWTMPFPGDHIYLSQEKKGYLESLKMGKKLNADAVVYSHVQDWEFLLDWDRVEIIYNDPNYVMIKWGHKYKYYRNKNLKIKIGKRKIALMMPPTPGFLTYKSGFLKEILRSMPKKSKKWQDMEHSLAKEAYSYKLLIPKKCLYRHVHGYWLEYFFKYKRGDITLKNIKKEISSWYIKTNYNWQKNFPNTLKYKNMCISKHPYFDRYFDRKNKKNNKFFKTPFDPNWNSQKSFVIRLKNFYNTYFFDNLEKFIHILKKYKNRPNKL